MVDIIKTNSSDSPYVYECRVIYADTDAAGVVYYGNYLRYFEEARTELLRANGLTYRDLEDDGFILPVVECYSRYKASARYDDLLQIKVTLSAVKKVSCRFDYRIERKEDGQFLMKGYTVHAVVNRAGKLTKIPHEVYGQLMQIAQKTVVV